MEKGYQIIGESYEDNARVRQYAENLRDQWILEQAYLRRLHRLWEMKRPAINTHIADLHDEIQRLEQEIDDLAEIYTHNTDLKKRLLAYAKEYPELCQLTEDDEQGGLRFEIDKRRIGIRLTAPYSPERRAASSQWAKKKQNW